ncbi:methyltransferase family protein [Azospirillum brasilense]|nr:methyltransferase family protein [Azospirillum brasilense]
MSKRQDYIDDLHQRVEGWIFPENLRMVELLAGFQDRNGVTGGVCEIGVHHGRFFIALHNAVGASETSVAVDVFEDQSSNIDGSGLGNLSTFQANLNRFATAPNSVRIHKADSLSLTPPDLSAITGGRRIRLFSIDGGHTAEHTVHDFRLAMAVTRTDGVIIVDDFHNPHWPGVNIGINRLFTLDTPSFAPFGYMRDKLLFTSLTWQRRYAAFLQESWRDCPAYKMVSMFGYDVVTAMAW